MEQNSLLLDMPQLTMMNVLNSVLDSCFLYKTGRKCFIRVSVFPAEIRQSFAKPLKYCYTSRSISNYKYGVGENIKFCEILSKTS